VASSTAATALLLDAISMVNSELCDNCTIEARCAVCSVQCRCGKALKNKKSLKRHIKACRKKKTTKKGNFSIYICISIG